MLFRRTGVIRKQLEVLLVHRNDYDLWNLPGGVYEEGAEDPVEAAIRETKEETGLVVGLIADRERQQVVGFHSFAAPIDDDSLLPGERRYDRYHIYIGVIQGGELQLTSESRSARWFNVEVLPENTYLKHAIAVHICTQKAFADNSISQAIGASIKSHVFIPGNL